MLQNLVKKIAITGLIVSVVFSSTTPYAFFYAFETIFLAKKTSGIVDKLYLARQNKNVVDNFGGGVERAYSAVSSAEREYLLDIGPINASTAANYVYASFFNPSASGRTLVIKHIAIRANTASSTASNYVNLTVRRTTTASVGTQIATTDIPKKNTATVDSVADVRYNGPTVTLAGTVDSRIIGQPLSGAVGSYYSYRDILFGANDEKIVLQPGEGIAVYQEAAGALATKVRVLIEWDEQTTAPTAVGEFLFAFPRVEVAAAANYVYNSFFNPAASGKSTIVKRIWFGAETCDTTAVYTNNIIIKRTSAASAGTAITATNIPKKNTSSPNSVMDFRRTGVTVTQVGGADARLGNVTPCGTTGQATGWQQINFSANDEKLILQPGEGIALISETAGDIDQLVRMIIEWQEVSTGSTPSSQGEYMWASSRVENASAINTTQYAFFNPVGSGKTAVIKRLAIRINADGTGAYSSYGFRRLTVASGGTLVTATDLPKKHTGTATSIMQMRWCGTACATAVTVTYAGTADSRLISVNSPGAIGQMIGTREIVFGDNEPIVLQPGEGIGLYNDVLAGNLNDYIKISIEWGETASAPTARNQYLIDIGQINGSTATSYNYATFFNPSASGKTAVVKRISLHVNTIGAAGYIPMQVRRLVSASAGTLIASSSIPKKHTGSATSSMEIRRTGVTATFSGTTDSKLLGVQTPGAVASVTSANTGHKEILYSSNEHVILQPGEGIGLYHDTAAGNANLRVRLLIEWEEVATANTPTSLGEYQMTTGPITQSTAANYVYSTFFNPAGTAKNYLLKRVGIQVNRSGTAVQPAYTAVSLRRLSAASAGTLVASTSVMKKHQGTATTSAEIRTTGVTATFSGVTASRLLGVTTPGVVNQIFGNYETEVTLGDEFILKPGEGVGLYQEQATGDALVRYRFLFEWKEESDAAPPQSLSFSISTSTIYLGVVSPVSTRYASSTNTAGSNTEVEAHTLSVNTNATNGYTIIATGGTLSSLSYAISAIGGTNTVPAVGTDQFGIRLVASGGSGVVTSPYSASGFAYSATATTSSQVASASSGDNATTTYSVRYMANIAPITPADAYTSNIVYIATANF
jgi:hypothetical protein